MAGRYRCFQGYFTICCIQGGACREDECPDFCAFLEGCMCNCVAISASRLYVMDKYNLASDPCDYRLIRINNCIQGMACICGLLAIFNKDLRKLARFLDCAADASYHVMSGCMTAQVWYSVPFYTCSLHCEQCVSWTVLTMWLTLLLVCTDIILYSALNIGCL